MKTPLFYSLPPAGTKMRLSELFSDLVKGLIAPDRDCFKNAIANYTKSKNIFFVSQGRVALTLILKVLAADSARKRVIIPSYTCYTVPAAIVHAGLQVLPVDIDPCTLDFDHERLEEIDTSKVLAIVPSNLYGIPNDLSYLETFAETHGIVLIDDAAQAFGARVGNRIVGTFGEVGFYSLSKGKSFTTLEGGIIVTRRENLAQRLNKLIEGADKLSFVAAFADMAMLVAYMLFLNPALYWMIEKIPLLRLGRSVFNPDFPVKDYNSFVTYVGAFLVSEIDNINRDRRQNAAFLMERLANCKGIMTVVGHDSAYPIYTRLPVLIKDPVVRQSVFNELHRQKLGASLSYPAHVNDIPGIEKYLSTNTANPNGLTVSRSIITLPTHSFVTQDDLIRISSVIERYI
jgi:perosamine synthetase